MDGGESPLEVLSRAATMLQENQQAMLPTEEAAKQNTTKQLPTTKWKRDRRSRPEYSRKSDPKVPEVFQEPSSPDMQGYEPVNGQHSVNGSSSGVPQGFSNSSQQLANGLCNNSIGDTPLDMSLRQRGQPPSYSQTVNNPGYRAGFRPSVITPTAAVPREELPTGISMCDPIIDEHFRRSLGKDYLKVFSNNNISKDTSPVTKPTQKITNSVIELMDNSGLSVDDHFAKALGDTWVKLNKKDSEMENRSTDKETVVSI